MARSRLASVVAVLALTAAGCSGGGEPTGRERERARADERPRPSETLVLQIRSSGECFAPLVARGAALPLFTLYGDGRVIIEREARAGADRRAVPALVERRLTKEGVDAVLAAVRAAGLGGSDRDYLYDLPTDLPTTFFTLARDGERHVTAAYGLGVADREGAVPRAHREPRRRLLRLRSKLLALERWLPAGSVSAPRPYEYTALAVYVQPFDRRLRGRRALEAARRSATAWPLSGELRDFDDPVAGLSTVRCGTVEGRDLERVLAAAKTWTPWRSGGDVYVLGFRPLLPGEEPCAQSLP